MVKRIRSTSLGRGDKWHLDEVIVKINGKKTLAVAKRRPAWRGARCTGAKPSRQGAAAKRLMRKLLKRYGRPRVIVTDKLRNAAANNDVGLNVGHRQHKGLNKRPENSHQPTRVREKVIVALQIKAAVKRFASVHGQVSNLFMGSPL